MSEPGPAVDGLATKEQTGIAIIANWDKELAELERLAAEINVPLSTPGKEADAADFVRLARGFSRKIEDARKEAVGPLNDAVKQINLICKKRQEDAELLEARVRRRLEDLARARDEQRRREQRAAEEEQRRAQETERIARVPSDALAERAVASPEIISDRVVSVAPHVSPEGIGTSSAWKYEYRVTDESILPRQYLAPSDAMLKAAAKRKPNPPEIPGVVWDRVPIVRVGR